MRCHRQRIACRRGCRTKLVCLLRQSRMPFLEDTGQIEMGQQGPFQTPSTAVLTMKPSRPSLAKGSSSTDDGTSTKEGRVDQLDLQLCAAVPHETPPSSRFRGASSSVTNPCLALPATDLTVKPVPSGNVAFTPENVAFTPDVSAGPTPEDMSWDMSDMSDGESFETRSSCEGLSSSSSLAESRRNILIEKTISWIISWIDSKLAVLAFQRRGAYEEKGTQESAQPGAKTYAKRNELTEEKREGHIEGWTWLRQ